MTISLGTKSTGRDSAPVGLDAGSKCAGEAIVNNNRESDTVDRGVVRGEKQSRGCNC